MDSHHVGHFEFRGLLQMRTPTFNDRKEKTRVSLRESKHKFNVALAVWK